MSKLQYVIDTITQITGDAVSAKLIVERLMEEGLLNVGYGDKDVDRIIELFKATYITTGSSRYDRFAAARMAKTHGVESVCGIIAMLAKNHDQKFCPVVNSVAELEKKWVSVLSFLRNLKDNSDIINA